jgi:ketosteroid isomerase-like protein
MGKSADGRRLRGLASGSTVALVPGENDELIRRALAHVQETGDIYEPGLDPDIVWHTRSDGPTSDIYRGIEEVRTFIRGWQDAFDDYETEIVKVIDRGEHIIFSVVMHGRPRGSSQTLTLAETYVYKLRDGKAIEVREYSSLEEALQALDVAESDMA